IKVRKSKKYYQFSPSYDGNYAAYVTNKMGKYKVYLYDKQKGRSKKIYRGGYKLDRINDFTFPLLSWHPNQNILAIAVEKKSQFKLGIFNEEDRKTIWRPIFIVEKVYDINFSGSGNLLTLSGMQKGQTDIYVLKLSSNV